MSEVYTYICTKSTVDPYLPSMTPNITTLARDVSDAFMALQGGNFVVGRLVQFPVQRSVANHLLCDGREVAKASFPELYQFLGSSQGTPADPDNFVLPDYLTAIVPAASAETETETDGTVTTPEPTPIPGDPPPLEEVYGDADSGGRPRDHSLL